MILFLAMLAFFGFGSGRRWGSKDCAAKHHTAAAQHERGYRGPCNQFVLVGFDFHDDFLHCAFARMSAASAFARSSRA